MTGFYMTLIAAFENGMGSDQRAVLEDAHLLGQRVHLHDPAPGGVRHAVEITSDADHALPADAPLELQDRTERRQW